MTFSRATVARSVARSVDRSVVLLAAGPADAVAALHQQAGPALAAALGLAWGEPLGLADPEASLAMLAAAAAAEPPPPPALRPLPLDPGLPLAAGGHWAERLGAWRQPALLLLSGAQLDTGLPAALVALLRQGQVPLLGLVQADGLWQPEARRRDGLPWLGALAVAGGDPEALRPALALRWPQLELVAPG